MKNIYTYLLALLLGISTAYSQITSTSIGGNWSDPATWVGGVVPSATDNVVIANNAVVTIDTDPTIQNLSVEGDMLTILQFESVTARTLTISTDINVGSLAIFRSSPTGSQTGHLLSVGGNFINNGITDFSTNGDAAAAGILFTGAQNASFGGLGSILDVSRITIDKGNSWASVLELNPAMFTFKGSFSTVGTEESFLTLINGTFKISGNFPMNNGLFTGTGNYTIPPTAGLWLNNSGFAVNPRAGTAYVEGLLQVDAGALYVGSAADHRLGYISGSVININGGVVYVASRFSATTTFGLSYTQTGGLFTVNTIGSTSAAFASFDLRDADNSTFTMSGGSIVLQNSSDGGSGPRDYINTATNINITGGTLQVGDPVTIPGQTFFLSGIAPSLSFYEAATSTARLSGDLTVAGNTSIPAGAALLLNDGAASFSFFQRGSILTNNGTLDATPAGSVFIFNGSTSQTYTGNGLLAAPIASLVFTNAAGVTFSNPVATDISASAITMNAGDITTGLTTLTLGTAPAAIGIFNYTSGTIIGSFKRWTGPVTGNIDFPVGIAGATRTASINFTSAPATGGTLTTQWVPADPGMNGLPLIEPGYPPIEKTAPEGFWTIVAADGLTGGIYTGVFVGTNVLSVTDFTQLVLLKRGGNAAPFALDGNHVQTTGSNTTPILSRTGMTGFSDFAIGGSTSSLPITIEYFRGSRQGKIHSFDWKISCTSSPGATMSLERSSDTRNFQPVNRLTATAIRCLQPFSFVDETPLAGINYYRLQIYNADGKSSYSKIIPLLNKGSGFCMISLMPNPVTDVSILNVASAVSGDIEIVITDISGKKIYSTTRALTLGSNQIVVDMTRLAAGTYHLTGYYARGATESMRFIKR